jgi:NADH-quinone oxidoreductase subunit M
MAFSIPYLLSIITFLPLLGAILVALVGGDETKKQIAFVTTLVTFVVSLLLLFNWDNGDAGMHFLEDLSWFPEMGIRYIMGVDGISLFLVLLTTLLMPIAIYFSNLYVHEQVGLYLAMMLLLETSMIGVFLALDLVLFFVFFEFSLIPMYLLIGRWGGTKRVYAALKFFLYTFAGSAVMLVAILAVYFATGTMNVLELQNGQITGALQTWGFLAFTLAFAIKVPIFPFHTWLPDAHVQAPTAGSIILAGILLKMGTYGYLRFSVPIFPEAAAQYGPWIGALALIGIIYGALVALVQKDFKSLVAYSSVAHLGYVMLGLVTMNQQGVSGSVLQMVNHGVSTGALFLMVGLLYERRHTRLFADFGGLWKSIPVYSGFLLLVIMSSAGLPGLNGFVGEFTILVGAYLYNPFYAIIGALGVILAAWYLLTAFRKVSQGPITNPANEAENISDLRPNEIAMIMPLALLFFLIGLFPNLLLDKINPSVQQLVENPAIVIHHAVPESVMPEAALTETVKAEQ